MDVIEQHTVLGTGLTERLHCTKYLRHSPVSHLLYFSSERRVILLILPLVMPHYATTSAVHIVDQANAKIQNLMMKSNRSPSFHVHAGTCFL